MVAGADRLAGQRTRVELLVAAVLFTLWAVTRGVRFNAAPELDARFTIITQVALIAFNLTIIGANGFPTQLSSKRGEQGGEQGPARGVPPLLRVDLTHTRSVRTLPNTAQAFDNFNGSSQLTMVCEGGALCRLRSTDVFRRALKASAVA